MIDSKQVVFLDQVFVRRPFFSAAVYQVDKLREVLGTNVFKNAIWLASPEFYRELEKKGFDFDALDRKERLTALKFYNRMSFRATPFGAFAAFGLVPWSADSRLRISGNAEMRLHLLPSVESLLESAAGHLTGRHARLAVNPTLYQHAAGWRYTRFETERNRKLSFFTYLLEYNDVEARLLDFLKSGPQETGVLVSYLKGLTGCTGPEGSGHLGRLVAEQVLVSGEDFSLLVKEVGGQVFSLDWKEDLALPQTLAAAGNGSSVLRDGRSFYAGLEMQHVGGGIAKAWQEEILSGLHILDLLSVIPQKDAIDNFREAFVQKFGERRVPLQIALDPDTGINYDGLRQTDEQGLLRGLEFPQAHRRSDKLTWTPVHRLLMKRWLGNTLRSHFEPVLLGPEIITELNVSELPLPPTISVLFSVAGDHLVLRSAGGATANALTGRFSAFSDEFSGFCRRTAMQEEAANPDIIFAEILQVSHRKIDNINRRRRVYGHAIPLNTFPDRDSILPADLDLMAGGDELFLLHRPSGKRVVPRLPTAFNYHHNEMPLFRFLCDLQFQSVRASLDFDPEKLFPGLAFYPRIVYGRLILSPARWHLSREDIDGLIRQPLSIGRLHLFCRERAIPPNIAAGRGDQQLVFDLSRDDDALFFLESLHDSANSVITEYLHGAGVMKNGDASVEFVASLLNTQRVYLPLPLSPETNIAIRDFPPGSEWVYMKIYGTPRSIEYVLLHLLLPWIELRRERIRQWFFVRFHDPDSHLRIRLRVDPADVKDIQFELQSLIGTGHASGLVQKAYFDTYQREIERYTAGLIGAVEDVFYRGSELVCRYLFGNHAYPEGEGQIWPVLHCYRMVLFFYGDDPESVIALCKAAALAFFAEHGGEKPLKRSMDDRFRYLRPALSDMTSGTEGINPEEKVFHVALQHLAAASAGLEPLPRRKLIADLVHMQINRIFSSGQRRHEAFIWHCLQKLAVSASKHRFSSIAEDPLTGRR